jgi:uncharacterized membrane protein
VLGGANNVFKVKKYCSLTEKGDAIVPPLNPKSIYAEILNKTTLALMFTSDILYFALFLCTIGYLFYFCQNIYFLKKKLPDPSQNQMVTP